MKIPVPDYVKILLPKDRELQWAAMSIVQKWINNYDERMEKQDTSGGRATFVLHYELDISEDDFLMFQRAGLVLNHAPEKVEHPIDMLIDLRDDRLLAYSTQSKHAVQAAGAMCGEDAKAVPQVRTVTPGVHAPWVTPDEGLAKRLGARYEPAEAFYTVQNGEWRGVVGYASWVTYFAASMYLPVVEILPEGRAKNWLGKFCNLGYRQVLSGPREIEFARIAMADVERMLCSLAQAELDKKQMQTEALTSTAGIARISSGVPL